MEYELSEQSLDYTIEVLLQHCKNKQKFRKDANKIASGGIDHSDYTNKGIRRSRVSGKQFVKSIFKNSAAAGSNFFDCIFDRCHIINANFQECSFIKSKIINNIKGNSIIHSNFNESLFADEFALDNNYFEHSVFYNTTFLGGKISNTVFYSCTLEGATFSDVLLKNVRFTDMNIDYALFENIKMHNVILPFSQICYTFGLLPYLKETTDEVYVTSAANEQGYISKDEFIDLMPHFIKYYTEIKDFFPLANIYFFMNDNEKAKQAILAGILEGVSETDFRKIKYLCKLIYIYGVFNFHERQDILDYIYSHISFSEMHSSIRYSYLVYKKEIESYLLNSNYKGIVTAEINVLTNVFPTETLKLGVLLSTIEEVIQLYKSPLGEHQIVCRHNSAEAFSIILREVLPSAIFIVTSLYSVLMAYYTLENKKIDVRIKKQTLKNIQAKNNLEITNSQLNLEVHRQQLINDQLDNKLKQLELAKIYSEQSEEQNRIRKKILSKNIKENDVEISEIRHIIYGNIPTHIDKDLVQFQHRKSNG